MAVRAAIWNYAGSLFKTIFYSIKLKCLEIKNIIFMKEKHKLVGESSSSQ